MQHAIRSTLRCTAMVLSFVLLFDQFAHAATQSHKLAALQAAQQQRAQQQQPPAPITRQNPERQSPDTTPTTPPLSPEALARQRLLSAHTLYLARSTQDARFPASPDDAYNLVLNNLKNWGHYQIVDNIAQADLVLQLRDAVHASVVDANDPNDASASDVYYLPSFQLTIADPSTLSPLWTVNTSIPTAVKTKNQPALLSAAATNLVSQLKLLAGDQLTPQDQAAQKQVTHYYHSHAAFVIGFAAVSVAAVLALFFIGRHISKDNAANFCKEHNLSPCPGA
ncbi:MAG TPA: hypothetical protein VIJ65_05860 [Acidobacteriaceae bacterium]